MAVTLKLGHTRVPKSYEPHTNTMLNTCKKFKILQNNNNNKILLLQVSVTVALWNEQTGDIHPTITNAVLH